MYMCNSNTTMNYFSLPSISIHIHVHDERGCRDIKSEKAWNQDWDGTLATNHFHITTLNKYS